MSFSRFTRCVQHMWSKALTLKPCPSCRLRRTKSLRHAGAMNAGWIHYILQIVTHKILGSRLPLSRYPEVLSVESEIRDSTKIYPRPFSKSRKLPLPFWIQCVTFTSSPRANVSPAGRFGHKLQNVIFHRRQPQ